ncbi:MAG: hypothetical protein IT424_06760 [Pirellulales bacterium]|nr:hypothetical protein [Pirellulales bacterium]
MYATTHHPSIPWAYLFRWFARVCGIILFAGWAAFLVAELFRPGFQTPLPTMGQAAALAVVFGGYALGWKHQLAGGLVVLIGLAVYFVVNLLDTQVFPGASAAWFAAPGVLYLLAWYEDKRLSAEPAV